MRRDADRPSSKPARTTAGSPALLTATLALFVGMPAPAAFAGQEITILERARLQESSGTVALPSRPLQVDEDSETGLADGLFDSFSSTSASDSDATVGFGVASGFSSQTSTIELLEGATALSVFGSGFTIPAADLEASGGSATGDGASWLTIYFEVAHTSALVLIFSGSASLDPGSSGVLAASFSLIQEGVGPIRIGSAVDTLPDGQEVEFDDLFETLIDPGRYQLTVDATGNVGASPSTLSSFGSSSWVVDFAVVSTPEPSGGALAASAGVAIAGLARRRRKRLLGRRVASVVGSR